MTNNKAFSLIELSIVLIVIGLFIAGITSGTRLIENAKIKGVINEFQNIEKSIFSFESIKNRLPGDIDNDGIINNRNNYKVYNDNTFKFPYNGTDKKNNHYSPDIYSAPFVEMYLENVYDFEPVGYYNLPSSLGRETAKSGGMPFSKSFKSNFFGIESTIKRQQKFANDFNNFTQVIYIQSYDDHFSLPAKIAEKIDFKIDEGSYNNGKIRGFCRTYDAKNGGDTSYKEAQSKKPNNNRGGKCTSLYYVFEK